jgi:hypothetical protein
MKNCSFGLNSCFCGYTGLLITLVSILGKSGSGTLNFLFSLPSSDWVDSFSEDSFSDDCFSDDCFSDDCFSDDCFSDDSFSDDCLSLVSECSQGFGLGT